MSDDKNDIDKSEWEELVDRQLRGELSESEMERLAELLDSDSSARSDFVEQVEWETRVSEALRESPRPQASERDQQVRTRAAANQGEAASTRSFTRVLLAIAALALIALTAVLFDRPTGEREIAKITGLNGSLLWTGDGGRVVSNLSVGTELTGGTVEGMSPESWVELEFNDGSVVMISGNSMLTFSDHAQKELHVKEGSVSCDVNPQPSGKPMLIHTRSAILEVLGTQFKVEAGLTATMLNVNEGSVRVKRLSDGSTVDVPARHRVVAAADQEMLPVAVPDSVSHWKSQLDLGPSRSQGNWLPATDDEAARLKAIPYVITTRQGKTMTLYTVGFSVSRGDSPPVILHPDSRFRVRGHIASTHDIFFGVTINHANGEFAGNFQTIKPASAFESGKDFEVILELRDFRLDPSLKHMSDKLPKDPFESVVESIWCHTLVDPAGLEISEIELIPPSTP
jgi:ferric-dicitrate binding protein FerR (iron transport regulator)